MGGEEQVPAWLQPARELSRAKQHPALLDI